jgi:DNA-binding NtrC family response regulator
MVRPKKSNTVLVVDDDLGPREAIRMILQDKYNVLTCDNPQEVLSIISSDRADVVMLDIKMPKIDGIRLLKEMKTINPRVEIVLITAYPTMQSAIEAMQYGAYDYVIKPFDKEKIEQVVRRGIIRRTQKKLEKDITSSLISEVYHKPHRKK